MAKRAVVTIKNHNMVASVVDRKYASFLKLTQDDIRALKVLSLKGINKTTYETYRNAWHSTLKKLAYSKDEINKLCIILEKAQAELVIKYAAKDTINEFCIRCADDNQYLIKELTGSIEDESRSGLAAFAKEVMIYKYAQIFEDLSYDEIEHLYISVASASCEDLQLGLAKDDGILSLSRGIMLQTLKRYYEKSLPHLCGADCRNAQANKCEKVFDRIKKPIGTYQFIKRGYQQNKNNGELGDFLVTECDNYDKEDNDPKYSDRHKMMDNIKSLYFDTETGKQADVLMRTMRKNGTLTNPRVH